MATKTAPINMRVDPQVRAVIDAAAGILSLDRSVFIQQAALREAQNVIADQKHYVLDQEAFDSFERAMSAPAVAVEGLKELLSRKTPWE
ncbi:MAG: DUF1778 domain-containing protein [Natronospirillum sp.]